MKRITKYLLALAAALSIGSCSYMDIVPDMITTIEDNAFSMRSQAEKVLFTCYSYMPNVGSTGGDPAMLGSDEIWLAAHSESYYSGKNLALGNQSATIGLFDYWRGANGGKNLYRGISDCNIFLANIGRTYDISEAERNRWKAEVEALKAYYHFYLIRMYGPVPIKDVNLSIQAGTEATHVFRNTLDECFDYVINKMDSVIKSGHLPDVIENKVQEEGRITEGIARILKAKMMVYRASPLFNGNTDYRGLTDKRGVEIFSPVKTEDEKLRRWADAANACREALDFLRLRGLTRLYKYTGNDIMSDMPPEIRLDLTLRMSLSERWNSDIIWANTGNWGTDIQQQTHPRELIAGTGNTTQYRANFGVPVKILYLFHSKNGVPVEEDKTWNYNARFTPRLIGEDQQYRLARPTDADQTPRTVGMHFDREPRYYASVGFDRGIWFGQGNTNLKQYLMARNAEAAANAVMHSWNPTGMYPKKLLHPRTSVTSTAFTFISYPFPIIRLPEVYLMYAEALNESANTQAARDEAIGLLDSIRARAGLRGVKESWTDFSNDPGKPNRQDGLRDIIKRETLIEFVFEGHRFWDLRRWKDALREYNRPITGWNLRYSTPAEYYNETLLHQSKFTPRDYFWPIYDDEILRNPNTLQNYGW
ncbi:MAG: RagB/SusD family nutrient uptake outer membrane protein [Prevotellaceae bacterium]|jgi:hypothetical protein|nr:RagB/SusD family nutrient uptake outer membrane protein [Prevotellaceae bacterium]